jgi:hypothetical protein
MNMMYKVLGDFKFGSDTANYIHMSDLTANNEIRDSFAYYFLLLLELCFEYVCFRHITFAPLAFILLIDHLMSVKHELHNKTRTFVFYWTFKRLGLLWNTMLISPFRILDASNCISYGYLLKSSCHSNYSGTMQV